MNITLPLLSKQEVCCIIPHKEDMALLDAIYDYQDKELEAGATLDAGSPFFRDGKTPGYVCFELIAQAISAYSFFKGYNRGGKPCMGFILKVTGFRIEKPFLEENAKVRIHVKEDFELTRDLYSFAGEVFQDKVLVASGKLMVMCAEDLDVVLKGESHE